MGVTALRAPHPSHRTIVLEELHGLTFEHPTLSVLQAPVIGRDLGQHASEGIRHRA